MTQENTAPPDPLLSEPLDVLLFDRTAESLEQENGWLKRQWERLMGTTPL